MTSSDLTFMPATALLDAYRKRRLSPVEVTRACLGRIEQLDERMGAFSHVDAKGALAAAAASEKRWRDGRPQGRIDGVPVTVKDLIAVEGMPTRRGSRTTGEPGPETYDAPCSARLREAGGIILGKTTTPEYGWKAVTDNPRGDVARNPFDPSRTAGGSSGGAAVAAALGMGALHIGTDGGGSIRIPSSFCGLCGFKPTFGRVPAFPLSPFGTVSHVGPMTRTVADAALMLDVIQRPDRRDWFAAEPTGRDHLVGLEDGIAGLRLGISPDLGFIDVEDEVAAVFAMAASRLGELGADTTDVRLGLGDVERIFRGHWYAGAANVFESMEPAQQEMLDPGLVAVARAGQALDGKELRATTLARGELGRSLEALFEEVDLLVTPTVCVQPFGAGLEVPEGSGLERWHNWAGFSYTFNLSQQPAITVPCGMTAKGLPVGLQIVGPKYADALVLRAGRAFESLGLTPTPVLPA